MEVKLPEYITGEYAVGTETFTIYDEEREEVLGPATGPRKISVRMYYPVQKDATAGFPRAEMLSAVKRRALEKAYFMKMPDDADYTAEYYANAPHVPGAKFPLILFSHGYQSYREGNTYLCCDLASHGYIIASIGHAYEAVANEYDDGTVDYYDKKINKKMYKCMPKAILWCLKLQKVKGTPEEMYEKFNAFQKDQAGFMIGRLEVWAQDSMRVVRELKNTYAEWIDFSKGIGASGHSMGGATAYYLCQHEPEISCGVNIDGGVFGNYEGMIMTKPFLQISCEANVSVATRVLLDTQAPARMEVFEDMKHIGFADAKYMNPGRSNFGKMDCAVMHKRLVECHLEVFDRWLKEQ